MLPLLAKFLFFSPDIRDFILCKEEKKNEKARTFHFYAFSFNTHYLNLSSFFLSLDTKDVTRVSVISK